MMMKYFFLFLICIAAAGRVLGGQQHLVVAADGTGDYKTVQEAFDAIHPGNTNPVTIFVKKGTYREKLHLDPGKNFVTLIGESKEQTILIFDDHTGKVTAGGMVINTRTSPSFTIDADDFRAEEITIGNDAGFNAGQAVALMINGDRCVFIHCRITGFQDTLFLASANSRCYFRECYIDGTTDFIFGAATAVFEQCAVYSKKNSHITAASTPSEHAYGFVFKHCRFTAADTVNKVTLGRPWKPYASVTYIRCYFAAHIIPQGWDNWRNQENEKTARYAEYKNVGPGAVTASRVAWSRQLTRKAAKHFSNKNILGGWNPRSVK